MHTIGPRLKDARDRANKTQRQVADRFGVVISTVCRWENGEIDPGVERIAEIAEFLGVDKSWLAFGDAAALAPQAESSAP